MRHGADQECSAGRRFRVSPYLFYAKAEEGKMFGTVRSGRPFCLLGRRMEREDLRMKIKNYCSFLLKRIIPSFRQNCKKYTEAVFPKPEKLKYEIPIELVRKVFIKFGGIRF